MDRHRRFQAFFEPYESRLRAFLRSRCPPGSIVDADDVLQELRVKIWNLLEREKDFENPASYLMRATVSTLIDAQRRAAVRRPEAGFSERDPEACADTITPQSLAELQQDHERLERVIDQLADDRGRVIRLYLQGFGLKEMARMTRWSEARCRNLLYRGLSELKTGMKGQEP